MNPFPRDAPKNFIFWYSVAYIAVVLILGYLLGK